MIRPTRASRRKILVVDDDPIVLEVVKARLEAAGFDVHVRSQALGTTEWISTHALDVVLLDVRMPALSGGELAQLLRRRRETSSVPIILHSSLPVSEMTALLESTGAIGAIQKGSDGARFVLELERIIARHRSGRAG
jgi:two-component system, response regulator PdtaR